MDVGGEYTCKVEIKRGNYTRNMRVVLTKRELIGKKEEWYKLSYVGKDGDAGSVIVSRKAVTDAGIDEDRVVNEDVLAKLFEETKPTVIDFNPQGRVDSVE